MKHVEQAWVAVHQTKQLQSNLPNNLVTNMSLQCLKNCSWIAAKWFQDCNIFIILRKTASL